MLILLGDSIIDNASYVQPGESDVPAQIRANLPEHEVVMRARDGNMVADVLADLDRAPLPPDARIVLSVGGNDALDRIGLLGDPEERTFSASMAMLHAVREGFRARYRSLVKALGTRRVLVCTIYNPNFQGTEADLQIPAEATLSAFNDVIQQEALGAGFDVLELREIFLGPEDYANPIEPSAHGGAKLAARIAAWALSP